MGAWTSCMGIEQEAELFSEHSYMLNVGDGDYCRSGNFHVKIIRTKNFRVVKFLRFSSICEIFLTVDIAIWNGAWRVSGV